MCPKIKPESYRAKLGDLGLARKMDCFQTESASFGLTGTPAFMAPEVLRGAKVTTAADVYGFALVLWEMASGEKPFDGLSVAEVLSNIYTFITQVAGLFDLCAPTPPGSLALEG